MNIFQGTGDTIIMGIFFPPLGWITFLGLFMWCGIIFWALRAGVPVSEGKRNWQGYVHSPSGKKRIVVVSVASILMGVVPIVVMSVMSGSHGLCGRDGKFHTDREFIRAALMSQARFFVKLDTPNQVTDYVLMDKLVSDYLSNNPDCCEVFRERTEELEAMSWVMWKDSVVVKMRTEENLKAFRRGEKRIPDRGLYYVLVDNCLYGTDVINKLSPGG
ncbi:MAG TPA: hypothetical protein VKC56_04070 [Gallionellaceae bacterium]|nr:hypothetical protein [Gallionellaceae bacterium]